MEWLQQGSRELFGTIIEDQVCTDVSLLEIDIIWILFVVMREVKYHTYTE